LSKRKKGNRRGKTEQIGTEVVAQIFVHVDACIHISGFPLEVIFLPKPLSIEKDNN
jgi:hypothetical protein